MCVRGGTPAERIHLSPDSAPPFQAGAYPDIKAPSFASYFERKPSLGRQAVSPLGSCLLTNSLGHVSAHLEKCRADASSFLEKADSPVVCLSLNVVSDCR